MLARSELLRTDGDTAAACLLLFVLAVLPGWLWLVRGMPHPPLWEVYAGAHFAYYWQPSGRENSEMLDQAPEVRVTCLLAVSCFLLAGWLVQIVVLRSTQLRRSAVSWGGLAVSDERHIGWAWWALWGSVFYLGLAVFGLTWRIVPQAIAPQVAALARIGGMLGVFFLALRLGKGDLLGGQRLAFFGGVAAYCFFESSSGLIGSSAVMCSNAVVGYTIAARRLPMLTMSVGLALLTFINLGKKEWRNRYMDTVDSASMTERFGDWVKFSWEATEARLAGKHVEQVQTALERTDLTMVLIRVVAETPSGVPFWNGRTYSEGSQLLVPRFINPNRPELHSVMRDIGISYHFHANVEMSQGTNISIGPIAEAWINRSWVTLVLAGACYGLFFAGGTLVARNRRPEQIGFLLGISFFNFIITAIEHLSMTFVMGVVQAVVLTLGVLFVLSAFQRRAVSTPLANTSSLPESLSRLQSGQGSQLD
jgi:hypothetical protein